MMVRRSRASRLAMWLGLLGGVVGTVSAASALAAVGAQPEYAARSPFGWAALALAVAAGTGGWLALSRPRTAALLMLGGSFLGFLAITLYYINTVYFVAPLLCLSATVLLVTARA